MRALTLLLCAAMAICSFAARTVINGTVSDIDGAPVAKAIVKVWQGKKIKAFANTGSDGWFSLSFDVDCDSLTVTVSKLRYADWTLAVPNADRRLAVTLQPEANQLREVVVSAPVVYQKGDTLRFNLAQLLGKGDVSLEDALKKVPGISVSDKGRISYMGKDISNFYIEGLEMLGGNYSLATRNLPAEHVSGVEVLNNHNEAKMDKDKLSDEVAINVRLKKAALLRPVGTSDATAGASDHKFLYALGATGLLFTPKMQATVSAKIGNIDEFAVSNSEAIIVRGAGRGKPQSLAETAIGQLSAGGPPLSGNRYLDIDDRMVSVNGISKIGAEKTLRLNASYSYHRQANSSSSSREYYVGDDNWLTVNNETFRRGRVHKAALNVSYALNADTRYVSNDFVAMADFHKIDMPVLDGGEAVGQAQKYDNFKIADEMYARFRVGRHEWTSTTSLSFERTPSLSLMIDNGDASMAQEARSTTFKAAQSLGTSILVGRSKWGIAFGCDYRRDLVSTSLSRAGNQADNDVRGHFMQLAARPSYQLNGAGKRVQLDISVLVRGVMIKGRNNEWKGAKVDFCRLYADPSLTFRYAATSVSKWTLTSSLKHDHGDLLALLGNDVAHDYRDISANAGILARNEIISLLGKYDFKEPINLWFASLSADFSLTRRNLLRGQYVTDSSSSSTELEADNRRQSVRLGGSVSKGVQSIKSKFTLSTSYSWSKEMMSQQGMPTTYYGTNARVDASANVRPLSWIEADLSAGFAVTGSRFAGNRNDFRSLDARFKLAVFPISRLELMAKADCSSRQLADKRYKRLELLDFRATYKMKSLRIRLSLNNLLDRRRYAYITYSGLDTYKYDYALRGREVLISLIFTK